MTSSSSSKRKEEDQKRIERIALGSMENSHWKMGFDYKKWSPAAEFADWRFVHRLKFEQRYSEFGRMTWDLMQNYHGLEKVAEKYRICEDQEFGKRCRAAAYFIVLHFYPPYYCYKNGVFNFTKLPLYEFNGPQPVLPKELSPIRDDLPPNWPFDSEEVGTHPEEVNSFYDPNSSLTIGSPNPDPLADLDLPRDLSAEPIASPEPVVVAQSEPELESEPDEDDFDIGDTTQMDMAEAIDWAWLNLGRKNLKRKDCPNGGAWYVWKLADSAPAKFFEIANRLHERREKEQVEIIKRQSDDRRRSFEVLNIVKTSLVDSIESRIDELLADSTREAFLVALTSRGFTVMRTGGAT